MSKIINTIPTPVDSYLRNVTNTEDSEESKQVKDIFSRFANYEYGSHLGQKIVAGGEDENNKNENSDIKADIK